MIIGVGTDILNQERVEALYTKYKKKFPSKILSSEELNYFNKLKHKSKVNFLCSSFCAKEAFVKALGTGFRSLYPSQITYSKNEIGAPSLEYVKRNNFKIHLSISNSDRYTQSFIVLEQ